MNRIAFLMAVVSVLPVVHAQDKPFFPLGIWYEGGVGDARDNVLPADPAKAAPIYEQNFADIAAHGINVMTIPNSPPDHHKLVLDTAQKHGLKVILELGLDGGPFGHMIRGEKSMDDKTINETLEKILAPIKDHPALYRVQLLDEPPGDAFERYGHVAAMTRAFNPRTEPFCCLTGGSDGDAFLTAAKSDVVAFDSYPIGVNTKEGDTAPLLGFASTAGQFRNWADKHNASAWAVVQCHAITGALRFPTPAEMSAMTWSALAEGNHGVFWFLYQSEAVGQSMMDGLVDRQFKARPLWDEVAKLTKQLAPLTATLAELHDPKEVKQDNPRHLVRSLKDSKGGTYYITVDLKSGTGDLVQIPPDNHKD